MIENRIKKLKAQISSLQEEIKKDMETKGIEEMKMSIFTIRFTRVLSSRFDTKRFKEQYGDLYNYIVCPD